MSGKDIVGLVSMVVAVIGYVPYVTSMRDGKTKPHAFSWITWTLAIVLVFFAQLTRGAGPGAWVTGISALACIGITITALMMGDKDITRADEVVFGLALAAVPLWAVTQDPLWSILLMVMINNLGFIPTFRKTYTDPFSENTLFFCSVVIKYALGIVALSHYSLVTVVFPLNCSLISALFLGMIYWRRHEITRAKASAALPVLPDGARPLPH